MTESKYTLTKLRKHTEQVRVLISAIQEEHLPGIEKAFCDFSDFVEELEQQPITLERNVKMMLGCKFLNHIYSALLIAERGLMVNAILCERNALETVAFHWLVCLDPNTATEYNLDNIPRPVEVRKRLEQLGADISHIRSLYASGSEITHVGRRSERFHSRWNSALDGKLLFGGDFSSEDQGEMFRYLPALFYLFLKPIMI